MRWPRAALRIDPENDMARRMEARLAEVLAARGEPVDPARRRQLRRGGGDAGPADRSRRRPGSRATPAPLVPRPAAGPLMRVLVTGGAGYIGSVSVERLVARRPRGHRRSTRS